MIVEKYQSYEGHRANILPYFEYMSVHFHEQPITLFPEFSNA